MFESPHAIKSALIATTLALSAFSLNAQAGLYSYTNAGVDLVHSSVSDVTWTKDGNLLGSLFASQGFNRVVNAIIAASPTISNTPNFYNSTGSYTITANDFSSNGLTSWFGAMAYVNYLNSISYGGSNQWYLPTVANTTFGQNNSKSTNGSAKGDELAELFYRELRVTSGYGIQDPQNKFINEQSSLYWSGTEYAPLPFGAWSFNTIFASQGYDGKRSQSYAWAVSPGQIASVTPVPEPESVAMLLLGLGVVAGGVRRRKQTA